MKSSIASRLPRYGRTSSSQWLRKQGQELTSNRLAENWFFDYTVGASVTVRPPTVPIRPSVPAPKVHGKIYNRTATIVENASTQTITGTRPADRQAGDLCIALFGFTATAASITGPAGWTQLFAPVEVGVITMAAYYRFDPPSDPVASTTDAAGRTSVIVQAYGGVSSASPIDTAAVTTTATATSITLTGLTTTANDTMAVIGCVVNTASRQFTEPAGAELVAKYSTSATGRAVIMHQDWMPTGSTSTGTFLYAMQEPTSLEMAGFVVALNPEPEPASVTVTPSSVNALATVPNSGPAAYLAQQITDSPTAHWTLNEEFGTVAEDRVGSRDGTYNNISSLTMGQSGLSSDKGNASVLIVNDALRYIEVPNDSLFTAGAFSIEALVQSNGFNGNNRIVQNGPDDSWRLAYEGGALRFTVYGLGEAAWTWAGDTAVHHIVGTWDAAGHTILYVDGREVAREVGTGSGAPTATASPLRIGQKPTGVTNSDGWNGYIDDVAFYSSALSPTRIRAHAQALGFTFAAPLPAAVAAVANVPAPTVSTATGATPTVVAVAAVAAVPAPTVTATATVTTASVAAVSAVPAPTVATSATAIVSPVSAISAQPAPVVKVGTPQAITFVAAASNGGNVTSQVVAIPATVQTDDGLIAYVAHQNTSLLTPASGWTFLGTRNQGSLTTDVYYRVAQAGDAGSNTTWSVSVQSRMAVGILAYRATDTTYPVDVSASSSATTTTTVITPSLTTNTGSDVEVQLISERGSSTTGTWTPPANMTERIDFNVTGSGGVAIAAGDDLTAQAQGASLGGDQWTPAGTSTNYTMFTIGLRASLSATTDATPTPGVVSAPSAVGVPTITATAAVTPSVVAAVANVPAPTITATATTQSVVVAGVASVGSITFVAHATPLPAVVAAVAAQPAVTITRSAGAVVAAVASVASVPAPAITASVIAAPAAVQGVSAVGAPTVTATATVTPSVVSAVAAVPAPTIVAPANAQPTPAVVAAIANVPTVGIGQQITPAVVAGIGAVPTPAIITTASPAPAVVAAVASVGTVTITAASVPTPSVVPAVSAVPTPSIFSGSPSVITFRATTQAGANIATNTITIPAGVQTGDGLLVFWTYSNTATPTVPGGWTLVSSVTQGSLVSDLYQRVAQAGDAGSNVNWTMSAIQRHEVILLAYAGTDTTNPIDGFATSTSTSTPTTPALSTVHDSCIEVQAVSQRGATTGNWTPPANITERNDLAVSGSGGVSLAVGDNTTQVASGTALGSDAWTPATATTSYAMWTVSLQPLLVSSSSATVNASTVVAVVNVPAPTVTTPVVVTPTAVAAVANVLAPTVQNALNVPAVTVAAVGRTSLTGEVGYYGASYYGEVYYGPLHEILTGSTVSASTVAAISSVGTVSVARSATVSAVAVAAIAAVPAPTVQTAASTTVSAATVAAVASVGAVTVLCSATVTPAVVTALAAVPAPAVQTGSSSTVPAVAVAAVASVGTVTITRSATVTVTAVSALASVPAPTLLVGSGATATPSAVQATAAVGTVTITTVTTATPAAVAAITAVPAPGLSTGSGLSLPVGSVQAVAVVPAPVLHTSSTVAAVVVAAVSGVPSAVASLSKTASVSTVAGISAIGTPTVTATALVAAVTAAAVASVPTSIEQGNGTASVSTVAAVAAVPAPVTFGAVLATAVTVAAIASTPNSQIIAPGNITVTAATVAAVARVLLPVFAFRDIILRIEPILRTHDIEPILRGHVVDSIETRTHVLEPVTQGD